MRKPPPKKPREPDPEECCGQGCAVCVWDKYDSQMIQYLSDLRSWVLCDTNLINQLIRPIIAFPRILEIVLRYRC